MAGCDIPPERPAGDVAPPRIALLATPGDVPVCIPAPRLLPSDALVLNVAVVADQGANIRVVHDPSEIVRDGELPPLVINWGGRDAFRSDLIAVYRPEAALFIIPQLPQ